MNGFWFSGPLYSNTLTTIHFLHDVGSYNMIPDNEQLLKEKGMKLCTSNIDRYTKNRLRAMDEVGLKNYIAYSLA